jgi:hypothetical protein
LGVTMFYQGFFLFVFSHPLLVMPLSFLLVWNIFFSYLVFVGLVIYFINV